MDEKQAIRSIDKFINMRFYHYALMINGKWGCGKTHFVQNTLIPHIKATKYSGKEKDVNYVSLYGINNTESITEQLCSQAIKDYVQKRNDKIKMEGKAVGIASVILGTAIKWGLAKADISTDRMDKIIELLPDYDNNVIIFDDLERCCCDVNEVLGFINNFIEHSNAAVIIIANEEEIGNWSDETNTALQLMIALNERIDIPVPTNEESFLPQIASRKSKKDNGLTLDQLNKMRSMIFRNNENYLRAREKVIGQTITYEPNLQEVYLSLINQNIENKTLKDALLQSLDCLIKVAHNESHTNIRTFLFFLEKISTIFEAIDSQYSSIHNIILLYCFRSSIRHMKGEEMPNWENDYGQKSFQEGRSLSDFCMGFRFIDILVSSNTMDNEYANSVLKDFLRMAEKKGQFSEDPYQLIGTWWRSNDKQVQLWLNEICKNIETGRYSTSLYPEIIQYIATLEGYNLFIEQCANVIQSMKMYISSAKADCLEEFEREQFFLEGESAAIYKKHYNAVKEILDTAMQSSEKNVFSSLICGDNQDNWSENLHENTRTMKFTRGRSFIYWIAPKELFNKIKDSNSGQIHTFRITLQDIYSIHTNYQHKEDDYSNLSLLLQYLEKSDTSNWDQIKNKQIEWLIADLKKYCKTIVNMQNINNDSDDD